MKIIPLSLFVLLLTTSALAQRDFFAGAKFSEADTLRGMLRPERTCFDVTFYDLNLTVDIPGKSIQGYVDIHFKVVEKTRLIQLDLYQNLEINEISFHGDPLEFERKYDAVFVHLPLELPVNSTAVIRVEYGGQPTAARNAPWDGGFVWKTDRLGRPWVAVACEGDGASLWWPCKDHLSDEPDSVAINISVPDGLTCASNGNLRSTEKLTNGNTTWKWFVSYPINTYNVSVNIANYSHFSDIYTSPDGDSLALDYYVLDYNLEKAKKHFQQVKPMLACYEKYLGKYPFWKDGYALIETPYLGMEHQSGIAYGNEYNRGYKGGMIPKDMDWDYLIIHESGHEYFGNSISVSDHADMWIHESFTTYLEALYVECEYGYEDYLRYLEGQRGMIRNVKPMVGPRDVNFHDFGSSDHYFKGAWVLHTFRHALNNDELFFQFLKDYHERFKFTSTSTAEFLEFVKGYFAKDWSAFWEQYLFYKDVPTLFFEIKKKGEGSCVTYEWENVTEGFDMPIIFSAKDKWKMVFPVAGEKRESVFPEINREEIRVGDGLFLIKWTP